MKNCPHCGGELNPPAKKAKSAKRLVAYINAHGKPVYYSKLMQEIIEGRARGDFKPTPNFSC